MLKTKIFSLAMLSVLILSPAVNSQADEKLKRNDDSIGLAKEFRVAMDWVNKGIEIENSNIPKQIIYDNGYVKCYEKAINILDSSIKNNPENDSAWFYMGWIFEFYLKKDEEALKCYNKVIELEPNATNALYRKGSILARMGKHEVVIKCFDDLLKKEPDHFDAWHQKGHSLKVIEKFEEALFCYNKAIELDPQNELPYINKKDVLEKLNRYEETIKCHEKIIELNPNDFRFVVGIARLYSKLKNKNKMLLNLEKAIKLNDICRIFLRNSEGFEEYCDDPDFIELTKDTTKSE